ncbi:MAG: hypothetical protein Q9207_002234 [Kuettlingeria erythrocarpa]
MADAEDKDKAEKLAAAKKRFEQLKKQKEKNKKAGVQKKKEDASTTKEDPAEASTTAEPEPPVPETEPQHVEPDGAEVSQTPEETKDTVEPSEAPPKPLHTRQPSMSVQSRMRSTSFRRSQGAQVPTSPSLNGNKSPILNPEDDVTEIYRKQAARLDELEKETKRLTKAYLDAETRYKRAEEELEDLRETNSEIASLKSKASQSASLVDEVAKLKSENASLQRQNSQLQSQSARTTRHASSPNVSASPAAPSDLQAQLESKSSTIESMELEISTLRSQLLKSSSSSDSHTEQIAALQSALSRAERTAGAAQRELADTKKNLERASEKAVKDGSERTSAETKMRTLTRENEEHKKSIEESSKRIETLNAKLAALQNLHKESDGRRQNTERDATEMRRRLAVLENENLRLREERERARKKDASAGGGGGDEELDNLEDEERRRLEAKIRALENEIFDLKRGVWREKRRAMSTSVEGSETGPVSPGGRFDEVDLSGPSYFNSNSARRQSRSQGVGSGFAEVLSSGFSAFTGGGGGGRDRTGSLGLLSDDGDDDLDEEAFRRAQEEESRKRIERVREVKRGLKEWEGWRMDVVDVRSGGGPGAGEIFDV